MAANGARFHVAQAGPEFDGDDDGHARSAPLVVLLHGFPQFWWAWRHQLTALAAAGYRVAAMDLRGFGASDKPPRGYDTVTGAADVAAVVRALGQSQAVVVGHDVGAWIAWSMPLLQPKATRAIAVVSMGHPLTMRSAAMRGRQRQAFGRLAGFQVPILPERRLRKGTEVEAILRQWSAPSVAGFPDPASVHRYRRAMQVPFVAHTSMEYFRWMVRSRWRRDGRRFATAVRPAVEVPVLQLHGGHDPWVLPEVAAQSAYRVAGPLTSAVLPGAGHFLPEEAPDDVTARLLAWLDGLPPMNPS